MTNDASPIHLLALRSLMRLFPAALLALALAPPVNAHVYCIRNDRRDRGRCGVSAGQRA